MATRKNATKITPKAQVNMPTINSSTKRRSKKRVKKTLKTLSVKDILIAILFLTVGVAIGAGIWFALCKNDKFDLVGQDELSFTLNQTYKDEGVIIIAFGQDDSDNIAIETNLLQNNNGELYAEEAGTYYIKYTTTNFKYGKLFKVQKVRLITFEEISEGGE